MSLLLIACINNSSLFCTSSPVYPLFRGTPGTRKQTSLTINTNPFAILLLSACPFLLERLSRIFRPDSSEEEVAAAVEPGQISGRSAAAARFLVRLLLFSYSNGLILYIRFLRVCVCGGMGRDYRRHPERFSVPEKDGECECVGIRNINKDY